MATENLLQTCTVARAVNGAFIDAIELDPCGIVRLVGWTDRANFASDHPEVWLNSEPLPLLQVYRVERPDVSLIRPGVHIQAGIVYEYLVPANQKNRRLDSPAVRIGNIGTFSLFGPIVFIEPAYVGLLNSREVLHRNDIYGFGPPNMVAPPHLVQLSKFLNGSVLDFGCGSGALVRHLRSEGADAYGIEMDIELIRNSLQPDVSPYITLYDGTLPAPFPDKNFDSIICSEVLEHIPQFEQAIPEFARLTRSKLLLTVPDIAAIPLCFRHALIPWHLLESTHVNFFSQTSLSNLLRKYFSKVEFGRMCPCRVNDAVFYISLVAFCEI